MCINFLLWELEAETTLYRAKILAISQILGRQLFNDESISPDLVDRPLDYARDELMARYEILEATRNNSIMQESQIKKSLSKFGVELPNFAIEHTKQCNRALEVWMATIGAGITTKKLDAVRNIWKNLSESILLLDKAIAEIKETERAIIEIASTTTDNEGIFTNLDQDAWKIACNYIPAQFVPTKIANDGVKTLKSTAKEAWKLALKEYSKGNSNEGLKWNRLAAEQGHTKAQEKLAWAYYTGEGVQKDHTKAVSWFKKSAKKGNAQAQYILGDMYDSGEGGLSKNYKKAHILYRKAADQGNTKAQFNLGFMYESGKGVAIDFVEALYWYNLATILEDRNAKEHRNRLLKIMTPADISKAQALAREWLENHKK